MATFDNTRINTILAQQAEMRRLLAAIVDLLQEGIDVVASVEVPAPAGGATEAKQDAQIVILEAIETNTAGGGGGGGDASAANQVIAQASLDAIDGNTDGLETQLDTANTHLSNIAGSASVLDDWDETDRAKVNLIVGQAGIAAGAGAVGTTVPRVTLASDDPAVASLSVLDDWDESDRIKANIIAGQAGIAAGAGAVGASTPRVTLASDDPAVAHLANAVASLSVLDDWDETDRAKVNIIAGQAGVAAGAGAAGVTTQRMILASDDPAVVSLAVIDDWDESDRAKVNLIVGQAGIAAGAGAVGATVPRVTLASDDPAVASLSILDDWDETDRLKANIIVGQAGVAGGAGSVGATTQRVTLASDDPAVTALRNANADEYETVAASQTDQILGATGAVGDFLTGLLIVPATTGAGNVSIKDGNGSSITVFVSGTLPSLVPFFIPIMARCVNSTTPGWKVTTGANVSVFATGNFT